MYATPNSGPAVRWLDLVAVVSVNLPAKSHVLGPVRAMMLIYCRIIY